MTYFRNHKHPFQIILQKKVAFFERKTILQVLALFPLALFFLSTVKGQKQDARNGWGIAPYGHFRVLVVFAEIDFDSSFGHLDPLKGSGTPNWYKGQLPNWKDELFDAQPHQTKKKGYMTRYFDQASFGRFQVTGDYIDRIITIPISSVKSNHGKVITQEAFGNNYYKGAVIRKVNELPFRTSNNLNPGDFDRWTLSSDGIEKMEIPNGKIDMVMIIFRNIHVNNLGDNSGFVSHGTSGKLAGMDSDTYSMFRMSNDPPHTIMRHEFSHMLYGGNNFHNASSGAGARTFLPTVGGWSNMSNAARCSETWNAWDRERMNWKNPENQFLINAICGKSGDHVNGELIYGQPHCNKEGIYILRDFVSSGDAIKIKLPHLPDGTMNQYLWLENHQLFSENIDHKGAMNPGLYAFISSGKDVTTGGSTYGGNNNYTWPLIPVGNYDFYYKDRNWFVMDSENENRFTGYHYMMRHPMDIDNNGVIKTGSWSNSLEGDIALKLECDGKMVQEGYCSYLTAPIFGTQACGFRPEQFSKIGISYNPAATPLMTLATPGGPQRYDNRRIWLNGISAEILDISATGDLMLHIRWDDFDIVKDARWCGDIVSKEQLILSPGITVTLDQGFSPQLEKAVQEIGGENVFAKPTILELMAGSKTYLKQNASIRVKKGSTLLVRSGACMEFAPGAKIILEEGAWFYFEKGASIRGLKRNSILGLGRANTGINPLLLENFKDLSEATHSENYSAKEIIQSLRRLSKNICK